MLAIFTIPGTSPSTTFAVIMFVAFVLAVKGLTRMNRG